MSTNIKMVVGTIIASVGIAAALTASGVAPAGAPKEAPVSQTTIQVWVTNPDGTTETKEEYILEEGNKGTDAKGYYTAGAGTYTVQTHLFSAEVDEWSDPVEVTIN